VRETAKLFTQFGNGRPLGLERHDAAGDMPKREVVPADQCRRRALWLPKMLAV